MLITRNYCLAILLFLNAIAFAHTSSEKKSITLHLNNASLIEVLKAIEKQSGVRFVYNTTDMKNAQKVSIDVKDIDLSILLKTICTKSGNNYKVINNQVVFYKVTESTTKSIKISTRPEIDDLPQTKNTPDKSTESVPDSTNKAQHQQTVELDIPITESINNTSFQQLTKATAAQNIKLIEPDVPSVTSLIYTNNSPLQENELDITTSNKLFLSLQFTGFIGNNPGFKTSSALDSESTQILNKSVSCYGYRESLYLGYALKYLSFKTGISHTQLKEEFTEEKTYNQFSKQYDWQVITWQEENTDGIVIHTDTVPVSQTVVTDSTVVTNIKYTYTYIEIPFYMDYNIKLSSTWSMFGSLGCSYAIYLKNKTSAVSDYYEPETENELDLSLDLNVGLKLETKHLKYYLMAGVMRRSTYAPKSNLVKRNPLYTSISIGITNYF